MKHGSLFSGMGGFDLAAEWMGWENTFHCEWNTFGQQILKYYWPEAISYEDITKTDFSIHRGNIDILTGGFPCQPYSVAGQRKGKDDERHLWPHMLRAIREIKPRWVVGENVLGLVGWNGGMVFEEVQADLEAEGYEVQPYILPAASVNAPHRRDRVWFVAHSSDNDRRCSQSGRNEASKRFFCEPERFSIQRTIAKPTELPSEWARLSYLFESPHQFCETTSYSKSEGSSRLSFGEEKEKPEYGIVSEDGNASNANNKFIQGWSEVGNIRSSWQERNEQSKRLHHCTDWSNFPTQSPICDGNDGFSTRMDGITFSKWRNESIKAGGNAIVPQIAFEIFKAIQAYESPVV